MDKVRTRFAPSPTGLLHIGSLRTALYAYALAKSKKGDFILRIEDTDKKREVAGSLEKIKDTLNLFDLTWDEYYVQSERLNYYKQAAEKLIKEGNAFYCNCGAKNAKEKGFSKELKDPCREKQLTEGAVKLKVPEGKISFRDFILEKEVEWDLETVSDTTLLKSDGYPTYHLASVVDDFEMKISHVLRGHDWMPSTPIHLLLYKFLDYKMPEIGHLTDILDPEGGKLSKRKGSVSCEEFLKEGYLPEAILNFIMLLGWAPKDNREIFSLEEFVKVFDPKGFQKSNPIFNRTKLDWFNGVYLRNLSDSEFKEKLLEYDSGLTKHGDLLEKIIPLVKDRIEKLSQFGEIAGFFFEERKVDTKLLGEKYKLHLKSAYEGINSLKEWNLNALNEKMMETVNKNNFKTGDFFMDLRIAITGSSKTPPINESIIILGKEETLKRLKNLI